MIIVEHRPPLKRIDFGPRPARAEPEPNHTIASLAIAAAKLELDKERAERIWSSITRAGEQT